MAVNQHVVGINSIHQMSFVDVLLGRRSRRFFKGAHIPSGPLTYKSKYDPFPLTEEEILLVLTAVAGQTGWHNLIPFNARYAPDLPNYAGSAAGRTFPSAAGFHTSAVFFTNDDGVYFFDTRNPLKTMRHNNQAPIGMQSWLNAHQSCIRKLSDHRLHIPAADPHIEGHNHWVVNQPGSLFVMPVADLAEQQIAELCYYLQNGYCIYDDINRHNIDGLDRFKHLYDENNLIPLSFLEQYTLQEANTELSIACYNGALMLQTMGLGGWMFNGVNPYSVLGASSDPQVPGLGFRYDTDDRWSLPNPTGLEGIFEGHCPPHFKNMSEAVQAFVQRKFGPQGPFHAETPGPWKHSAAVRGSAKIHNEEFIDCITVQADYIYQRFGRFPGTLPTILTFTYLQAHHLDLDFYDEHFEPGAYLASHANHMENWH